MIIDQCRLEGSPLPEKIANAPELFQGLELYWLAFLDLTTCRATGYGEGLISWFSIRKWAEMHNLDEEQTEDLHFHIPAMDKTYLDFKAERLKAETKK